MISYKSINEVKSLLSDFGLYPSSIHLGEITIDGHISVKTYKDIDEVLYQNGFELVKDKEIILAEKIENVIIEMIYLSETLPAVKYSNYISDKLEMNYAYLSRFFSNAKKFTIEKFIIMHKVEFVKQLLLFNEMSLSDIAWRLNYSSTNHLCSQFKKITGFSPSGFKKIKIKALT
ncbi:MAG: AraC family transcriptional regulator [Ferruginibacter sp.]